MSRDEMRAKLAELMGWRKLTADGWTKDDCWPRVQGHPVPKEETIDALMKLLPKGWEFEYLTKRIAEAHGPFGSVDGEGDDWYDTALDCVIAAYESERRRA